MRSILTGQIRPQFFFTEDDHADGRTGGQEPVYVGPKTQEFNKRFAPPPEALRRPPADAPKEEPKAPEGETPESKEAREKASEERRAKEAPPEGNRHTPGQRPKRPGSNVPNIIEGKKIAEKERDDLKLKIEDYESKKLPELNSRIDELQKKIDSGNFSSAKEQEFQNRINKLESEKATSEEALRKQLSDTQKRLAAVSIVDDPMYKEKYVKPLGESIGILKGVVGSNQVLAGALDRAMRAQKAVLQAGTEQDRTAAEQERDGILESMLDGMPSVQQRRLNSAFDRFMETSENQAVALAEHEATSVELRREAENRFKQGAAQAIEEWSREYESQEGAFEEDFKMSDEVEKIAKELKVAPDMERENKFAKAAIAGELKRPDVVRLIHRGRAYAALKAKAAALEHLLADRDATIGKLRGASPPPGSRSTGTEGSSSAGRKGEQTNRGGQTREQWQRDRFRPGRAAAA